MSEKQVAFLFTGQGSQYVGMGEDLYEAFPESKLVFDKADNVLTPSISERCFRGTQEILRATIISQPAILTVSIAAFEAFKTRISLKPAFLAGLSLGEYSALIAAGSFSFGDGLRLVKRRAEIMEEAAHKHPGKMVAVIGLSFNKVKEICFNSKAEIANINSPQQIVISGKKEAVDYAKGLCIESGAGRVIDLEVSGGFHSSLMQQASAQLKQVLDKTFILPPQVAVISNYTALPQCTVEEIKENLVYQMHSSVRWEDTIRFILSKGVTKFFEFGPGKVLKGLMRQIDSNAQVVNIEKKEDILNLETRNQCPET